jgi:mannitol 2-dehydrogenase
LQQIPLSRAALSSLDPSVGVPAYDPAAVTAGIVHLGFGGFHRAHMARYTHDLMQADPEAVGWGVVGAGLLPADRRMAEALGPQGGLYTLVERDGGSEAVTVIGCIAGLIHAAEDSAALLDAIDAPGVRIVSLTVTEHGYCLNAATKRLDPAHPAIAADLADPARPHSAVGILVEAYRRRRDMGRRAFTGLSCDNIQHNGQVLKGAVLDFARLREPEPVGEGLADWIAREARFPDTMVDRITPATRPGDTAALAVRHGIVDAWPVFAEPFRQWVVADDFADDRPAWERVGVQFVPDVAPYETMKLRLLNASHLAVAGLGRLMGYVFIDETMRDDRIARYMAALMDRETGPTVPSVPGVDLTAYKASLIGRFANPTIKDTVERVNTDAPLNYLIDPIRDRLAAGESIALLALAVAAWIRRMTGVDEAGVPMIIHHPLASLLRERALEGGPDPRPVLAIDSLFGDIGRHPAFVAALEPWLASLHADGAASTLVRAGIGHHF